MIKAIRSFIDDQSGSAAALFAVSAPPLLGMAAVAIDIGSLYMAERKLQGIADAAAAAAVVRPDIPASAEEAVSSVIAQSGEEKISVFDLNPGIYTRDPGLSIHERFVKTDEDANSVELRLTQEVDLLLAGPLLGNSKGQIAAFARAAKTDLVAFELNTKTVAVDNAIINGLLSGLTGNDVDLSDDAIDSMLANEIDIMRVAQELGALMPEVGPRFGDLFAEETPLGMVLEAMAQSTEDTVLSEALMQLADDASEETLRMEDIIDLGPFAALSQAGKDDAIMVDVYSLLRIVLEQSKGEGYDINLNLDVAGLSAANVRLAGGRGFERSPWLTITAAKDIVLRTAQTRLYFEMGADVPGAGKLKLPFYLELAPAEAQITAVECDPDAFDNGVSIDARPSIGGLALAEIDGTQFSDFSADVSEYDATLLETRLAKVTGFSHVDLGGGETIGVRLSLDEIADRMRKEVGTQDLFEEGMASLLSNLELETETLGIGLGTNLLNLEGNIGDLLASITPQLDSVFNGVTSAAGVKLGVAEIGVTKLRCGRPVLVA